jgi:hypothetical protein
MRTTGWIALSVGLVMAGGVAQAGEQEDRLLGGVLSGVLGVPQQSPEAAYSAKERGRLVSMLQAGEYVTSRQGETIDVMVYGIPLTHRDHVYIAKPVPPSQTSYSQPH